VFRFRIIDCSEERTFYIAKSTDAERKSKNFIALIPKCLVSSFSDFLSVPINTETTFRGLVLEIFKDQVPVVSVQPELIELKSQVPTKAQLDNFSSGTSFIGLVNGISINGQVSIRFFDGVCRSIKVKDLNTTKDY
jgi:hypothetical protein